MLIFGITVGDWVGIISIATTFVLSFRALVTKPLQNSIDKLSLSVQDFKNESTLAHEKIYQRINQTDDRVDEHEVHIGKLDERVKTLFSKKVGKL